MSTLRFKVFLHVEEMLQDGCPDHTYIEQALTVRAPYSVGVCDLLV